MIRRAACCVMVLLCAASAAQAHEGWGIVVRPDGTIYFADIPTNTIWRLAPDGSLDVAAAGKHSHALVMTEDGSIYGTHEHVPLGRPGEVWRIDPRGALTTVFAAERASPFSLQPFATDGGGSFYSTNIYSGVNGPLQIMRREANGQITIVAGGPRGTSDGTGTAARFEGIDGTALAPDGSLYFTDAAALRRVTPDGAVSTIAASLTASSWGEDLMGVTRRDSGDLYVADYSRHRVLRVREGQGVEQVFEAGWPWAPTGVAFRGDEMFVLEHLRMPMVVMGNLQAGPYVRIRRMDAAGEVSTLKTVWGTYSLPVLAVLTLLACGVVWLVRRVRGPRSARTGTKDARG